jgi:Protein of unknown function (DUF2795)
MPDHTELQKLLSAVDFPCRTRYLISRALYMGAADHVLQQLHRLPERQFNDSDEVRQTLSGL